MTFTAHNLELSSSFINIYVTSVCYSWDRRKSFLVAYFIKNDPESVSNQITAFCGIKIDSYDWYEFECIGYKIYHNYQKKKIVSWKYYILCDNSSEEKCQRKINTNSKETISKKKSL